MLYFLIELPFVVIAPFHWKLIVAQAGSDENIFFSILFQDSLGKSISVNCQKIQKDYVECVLKIKSAHLQHCSSQQRRSCYSSNYTCIWWVPVWQQYKVRDRQYQRCNQRRYCFAIESEPLLFPPRSRRHKPGTPVPPNSTSRIWRWRATYGAASRRSPPTCTWSSFARWLLLRELRGKGWSGCTSYTLPLD